MILEIHLHSKHSDGLYSPRIMAKHCKKLGLDGFALTDHNKIGGLKEARRAAREFNLKFIPGLEVSTDQGHVNALFIDELVKRGPVDEVVEKIKDLGGISVAVHPYDVFRSGVGGAIKSVPFDYIEIFNARTVIAPLNAYTERVADKLGLKKVAGSDAHNLDCLGLGLVGVDSLDDFHKGRVRIEKKEWAGIRRISVEKTQRIINYFK